MSTYGNRPPSQTETVNPPEYTGDLDDYDSYVKWFNDVWSPWMDAHADDWLSGDNGVADDNAQEHEDTGVCSDESMYMPHAQALVLDYGNEIGSKFWKRGRKQWKRFLNQNFADPVSLAQFVATTYGLARMNMDIYAWRRTRATYDALNSGRYPDAPTPMVKRIVKSLGSALIKRSVRRRLF